MIIGVKGAAAETIQEEMMVMELEVVTVVEDLMIQEKDIEMMIDMDTEKIVI